MAKAPTVQPRELRLEVVFHGQEQGEALPPTRAYLFDRAQRLVSSEPISADTLSFKADPTVPYRLLVGPELLGTEDQPPADLLDQLTKARAISRDIFPQAKQDHIRLALSKFTWFCWWETCIVVHGTVRKQIGPGIYAPICDGTVQIFQVDLGCTLDRLDSFRVLLLRELLSEKIKGLSIASERLDRLQVSADVGVGAEARSIGQVTVRLVQASASATDRSASISSDLAAEQLTRIAPTSMRGVAAASSVTEAAATLVSLPAHLIKQYLVANKSILWWFLCDLIPDWAFCWQELGEVPIQSEGTFSAEICFWCPDDFPDLYFEVVQTINGSIREIYDPQIACSTYYDYDGSRSVDIIVEDPSAVACLPYPPRPVAGMYVWPTAIGNTDLNVITDLSSNPAVSNAFTGLVSGTQPWGGTLALQMAFDPTILSTGVRYYRWSYKFEGDADFTQINETVTHRYRQLISTIPLEFTYQPFTVGPHTVTALGHTTTNLYHVIPDLDPSPGGYGWVDVDDPSDRPFAYFDSTGNLLPKFTHTDALPRKTGLCTLLLELFDANGVLVPCGNVGHGGPFLFVLPNLAAPGTYTSALTANNVTALGQLFFRVRIDNEDTVAQLPGVHVGALSADADCGLLHVASLSELVSVDYVATHPNNFLSWDLTINRGHCGNVVPVLHGNSSSVTNATYTNAASVLLGTTGGCSNCPAGAAFDVDLNTYASATDGYGPQTQYNRRDTRAFALLHP